MKPWAELARQRWPFFERWILGSVVTLRPREIWAARVAWICVALAGSFFLADVAFGSKNIARGRRVTASSICPLTPAAEPGEQRLFRVVDGIVTERGSYAVCTDLEVHPWVTVDLGAVHRVDRVVVHPRSDCCWGDYDLPMRVELSMDKTRFGALATMTKPFTDDMPWTVDGGGRRARFVRLTSPADIPRHVIVSEVEVLGR